MKLTQGLMAAFIAAGLMGCGPTEAPAEQQPQVDEAGEVHAAGCWDLVTGYFVCPENEREFVYSYYKIGGCGFLTYDEAHQQCESLCGWPCLHAYGY